MSSIPVPYGERRATRPQLLDRVLAIRIPLTWELAVYGAIILVAVGLRLWSLGAQSLHHDESIHAHWSWRLAQGDYHHSPTFHGPFYYHVQGFVFFLFGASDYTARLSAAIFGSTLVLLPLLIRRWLGPAGTIAAVAFLALSPTLVYYSRFFREDIYMAVFVLLMAAAMWRYLGSGKLRWLAVFAACFTGGVLTKEGMFLTVAVFLVFLDLLVAHDLAVQTLRARGRDQTWRRVVLTGAFVPWAWLAAALWPFTRAIRQSLEWTRFPRSADVLVLLGTLVVPLLTPILRHPLEWTGLIGEVNGVSRLDWQNHLQNNATVSDRILLVGLFSLTTAGAAFIGLQWKAKFWALTFASCALVYLTLMTFFWTNLDGLVSGLWGSIDYWSAQQSEHRADQPWFYYDMTMPMYEFLPLAIAVGGAWWSTVRGNAFSRFLWVWLIGQWLALSYGAEKMPWLNVHLAVPACILAAWTVNRAWRAWRKRPAPSFALVAPFIAVAIAAAVALVLIVHMPGGITYHAVRVAVALAAVVLAVVLLWRFGRWAAPLGLAVFAIGALGVFSVQTMGQLTFERRDVPKDLLIYTQSSPDIREIMANIDRLAASSGKGKDLPIAVDAADSFAWPWVWYLRDYRCVTFPDFRSFDLGPANCGGEPEPYAVLLVNTTNAARITDQLTEPGAVSYGSPISYPHRWWFNETYKSAMDVGEGACTSSAGNCGPRRLATWEHIADNVFTGSWLKTWFFYWRDHDPDRLQGATGDRECNTCGSVNGQAYFPANFDLETGVLTARPVVVPGPSVDEAGRPVFGSPGLQPGQFLGAIDIEADAAGNLYVIDHQTRRLQKFDSAGNLLVSVDIRDEPGSGEASQPWGLAVGPNGEVVVADTFGWRVRVFDSDLNAILSFGDEPRIEEGRPPGDYELYGPRDVAVDAGGQIWATDTGHGRVVVYTRDGVFVRAIGEKGEGPGEFDEPVGIDIAADGLIYVADMFNARVVVLDPDGAYVREFAVDGWGGTLVNDKPYLHVLGDGRIALSLPRDNRVAVYTAAGELVDTIAPTDEPLSLPYGIVDTADGKLWIVEGGANRVRQFPLP